MNLQDIGTNELRKLNLYPICHFNILKKCFEQGYFIIPTYPFGGTIIKANKYERDGEKIKLNSFLDTKKEELEKLGFSGKTLFKLLWLQKYLRGEVVGYYSVEEDSSFRHFQELAELDKKDKIIHRLNCQLAEEKEKNKELQDKINELENEVKKADKLKSKLLKFIEENKKFLEDYSSNLN